MKSFWVRVLILAVVGLGLGGAFALFYPKNETPSVAEVTDINSGRGAPVTEVVQQQAETPVSAQPVLEGVPPMPVASVGETSSTALPVAGVQVGGPFSLTDHKGNAVTEKSWPGKYKLVFFGFTHCPDICPVALQKISTVMTSVDVAGEKLAPVFITVDPARDTPDVMAAYVSKFHPSIAGLTGTPAQIEQAVEAYKVFAAKVPDGHEYTQEGEHHASADYAVDHSGYVYFMSPDGVLLETFSGDDSAENMISKIQTHTTK